MHRSTTYHAKCFVPSCKNTTTTKQNKLFVVVKETMKPKWCRQVNIEYKPGRRLYCCEDHLNLEEDLENYQYFKLMKGKPILKSTAKLHLTKDLPSCSKDETAVTTALSMAVNDESPALKLHLLQSIENLPSQHNTTKPERQSAAAENYLTTNIRPTDTSASTNSVKINAATQCQIKMIEHSTSTEGLTQTTRPLHVTSASSSSSFESTSNPSLYGCTSDIESTASFDKNPPDHNARKQMLQFISSNPKAYIGLPKQYFWLINHIVTHSVAKITELDIILTLFKIKLNMPIIIICDLFQISRVKFSQSFHAAIVVLANFFQNLIYMPSLLQIKQNQPLAFKIRYSNVLVLLDAFEIETQKPHNPIPQAQTWSQYKNANTVKYLIGSTPNGFVSFVSKGYGGRISDKALVEKSNLIDCLPNNAFIMADRGFKEIEGFLVAKGIKLLRPPSVYASNKPTKEEVIETKVVASLRVHIERVIRRVREFKFLKAHSVVSHKHIGYLDHIVLIVCGLINLQNEIIKSE